MLITSTMNKFLIFSFLATCFLHGSTAGHDKEKIVIKFVDNSEVEIKATTKKVSATYSDSKRAKEPISVNADLSAVILKSDSMRFIMHNPHDKTAIIISSEPSKNPGGLGFCGAGHEDYALLVEKKKNIVILKDRYLLQSCLKSITLDADDPEDVLTGLSFDSTTFSLSFKLLDDSTQKNNFVSVKEGKFVKR